MASAAVEIKGVAALGSLGSLSVTRPPITGETAPATLRIQDVFLVGNRIYDNKVSHHHVIFVALRERLGEEDACA
jgi:hypothetical protein